MGEYTQPTLQCSTHTQPFHLQDIQFYCNQFPITFTQLLANLLLPNLVHLRIDNQKNGCWGQIISHHTISIPCCPVKAVTACVLSLLHDGAQPPTPICTYKMHPQGPFAFITNDDIVAAIHATLAPTQALNHGYKPKLVCLHSLQVGGTMALFQNGADVTTIMKLGHWTSTSFMLYLHEQMDILSKGAAECMSMDVPYVNLDITDGEQEPPPTGTTTAP